MTSESTTSTTSPDDGDASGPTAGLTSGPASASERAAEAAGDRVLRVRGLTKSFVGTTVLADVDLDLIAGQVHGLVGENGAGKSTLMKVLAGVHRPDHGTVEVAGQEVRFGHPVQALRAGVATVFQEFTLLPDRTVAENVYLGREPRRAGIVDVAKMRRDTSELLAGLGVDQVSPDRIVSSLSVAEQQVVEIVKAISYDARIISMDEPTAALADHEVALLYSIIRRLTERGVAILYVSHRLKEIFDLCNQITVLKDGRRVSTGPAEELDDAALVRLMVGRSISAQFPDKLPDTALGEPVLRLAGSGNGYVDGIDLTLRAGEIVGIAGLQGSGRTELVEGIFGIQPFNRGTMTVGGNTTSIRSPRQAVRRRLALVTEDRKTTGLALNQSIRDNALAVVRAVFPRQNKTAASAIPGVLSSLEVSSRGLDQEVQFLSGGNQQKVVLARWLAINPRVVLMDEPTRGIDVGAKQAVYDLMRRLAHDGVGILMVSSELPEVLGICDRVLVMRDGRLAGELSPTSTEEEVLHVATGARKETA